MRRNWNQYVEYVYSGRAYKDMEAKKNAELGRNTGESEEEGS